MVPNSEIMKLFYKELNQLLTNIHTALTDIEHNRNIKEQFTTLMRNFHTIKGNSHAAGFSVVGELAHKIEDYIVNLIKYSEKIDVRSKLNPIYQTFDIIEEYKNDLSFLQDYKAKLLYQLIEEENINITNQFEEIEKQEDIPAEEEEVFKSAPAEETVEKNQLRLVISLNKNCNFPAARIQVILNRCKEWGKIINIEPSEKILFKNQITEFRLTIQTNDSLTECITRIKALPDVVEVRFSELKELKPSDTTKLQIESKEINKITDKISEAIIEKNRIFNIIAELNNHKLDSHIHKLDILLEEIYDNLLEVRLVSIGTVFEQYHYRVRQVVESEKKKMKLEEHGKETLIDQTHMECISNLVHLITNAITHGIESPEERIKNGKSEEGKVIVSAEGQKDKVIITVEDDGRGIDEQKIKEKAIKQRIIEGFDTNMSILDILSHPGFSTKEDVNLYAGRGYGLSSVIKSIHDINGIIELQSETDKFTRFTITIPLTIALIRAVIVNIGGQDFAIPITHIKRIVLVKRSLLVPERNGYHYDIDAEGNKIFCIEGSYVLTLKSMKREECGLIILDTGDSIFGIIVDKILDERKIYIMKIDHYFNPVKGVSSATIQDDGLPLLVLDIFDFRKAVLMAG